MTGKYGTSEKSADQGPPLHTGPDSTQHCGHLGSSCHGNQVSIAGARDQHVGTSGPVGPLGGNLTKQQNPTTLALVLPSRTHHGELYPIEQDFYDESLP